MSFRAHPRHLVIARTWHDDRAAQIVEFAVSLPLLMMFVVGIFDFNGAFTLKEKLTNAARDAARIAAADPTNDLSHPPTSVPISIADSLQAVHNYLLANNINDCGILTASPTVASLTWTYSKSGSGCPGTGISLIINREYYFPSNSTTSAGAACSPLPPNDETTVMGTCVNITYGYQWRFDRVITLLGLRVSVPSSITATAVAMNEN